MTSFSRQTGSQKILPFLLGLLLVFPEDSLCLELNVSSSHVLLNSNTSFTVVCSGWSQVTWVLPRELQMEGVVVDDQGSSSLLQIFNASWQTSGRYTCKEASSDLSKAIDVFVPGNGPEQWFVPQGSGPVMKEAEEDTIPCVVSDPRLNVSLYERPDMLLVTGLTYEPGRGFTGRLNDTSYECVASAGAQKVTSQPFYVFSIIVSPDMEVDLTVSSSVLKRGDVLTVNCTVKRSDVVYFTWEFPRRQEIDPLTEFLPKQIRSFVNISAVSAADSGSYVCTVRDTVNEQTVRKNISVVVLDRGYVYLWPLGATNVSSLLHHNVELQVELDAHPAPTVLWTKDNQSIARDAALIRTTHLTGSRYMSKLTLVRVRLDQAGSYTATGSNEDGSEEVVFNLEIKVPPKITALSEISKQAVLCIGEGTPPPSVTWYTCHDSHRCSNSTGSWRNQSAASDGSTVRQNVTQRDGLTQVHSVLSLRNFTSLSAVRCETKNSAGQRARDLRIVSDASLSQVLVLAAVLVLVVMAMFFLIVLIVLLRKKPRYEVRWKVIESVSPDGQQYTFVDPEQLPYDSAWEVPRDSIVLGQVLGSGAFGRVVEATVSGLRSHPTTKVAIKMVKSNSGAVQSLLSELKILIHVGRHLNVVNLLGACTSGGPVYLITEFCRHGDLVKYLQGNKHTFLQGDTSAQSKSDPDGGYMDMNKDENVQYVTMKECSQQDEPLLYETLYTTTDQQGAPVLLSDSTVLTLDDLLGFSFQVSQAMDFLSSRNCVHRDLAARNVLVCDGKLVKVCDFGLSRDVLKHQDYVARGNSFLPVRWMPPESLFQNIYSCQSDVWSYGVLLWEIFSLGNSPYPELPSISHFYPALKKGHRMSRPPHAPQNIFDLMTRCWEEEPQSRPSFTSLAVSVGNLLPDDYKKHYGQLAENFLTSHQSPGRPTEGSPASQAEAHLMEAEPVEAGPSQSSYIIPVSDVTIESGDAALDAVSPLMLDCQDSEQEVTSSLGRLEAAQEEESCL